MGKEAGKKNIAGPIIFMFGFAFIFAVVLLAYAGTPEDASQLRQVCQASLAEFGGCVIAAVLFCFFRKALPAVREMDISMPSTKVIASAFLLCPFLVFLQACAVSGDIDHLFFIEKDINWEEIAGMLLELPLVALFGPFLEEFCCRIFAVSPFRTKRGRITAAVFSTVLFAFMHVSRWSNVIAGSILYTALLLLSKNIWLPVIFHAAHNLSTILLPASSGMYVLLNPNAEYGVMGTAVVIIAAALIMFCIGIKLLCEAIREHKISACTTPHFDDII